MSALRDAIEREIARRLSESDALIVVLRRENGALRGGIERQRDALRRRQRCRMLPHFDMNDPQIVEKLLATTKGKK